MPLCDYFCSDTLKISFKIVEYQRIRKVSIHLCIRIETMIEPAMVESGDKEAQPVSDTTPSGNTVSFSEENSEKSSMEKKDPERSNSDDNCADEPTATQIANEEADTAVLLHGEAIIDSQEMGANDDINSEGAVEAEGATSLIGTTATESTSTETPNEEADTTVSLNGDAVVDSEETDTNDNIEFEGATEAEGRTSPIGTTTSEVDSFPKGPDIDVDTNVASPLQRIEPEGATPVVGRASVRFDNVNIDKDVLKKVLLESQETQEDGDETNHARMERIESEDAVTIPADKVVKKDEKRQKTSKKKRQEPPGTPAKHERQKSETPDERERRIQATIKEKEELDERRVHQILHDKRGVVEEKKGDDDMSIQREPAGSVVSENKIQRESWKINNDQVKQPTKIVGSEKQKEIASKEELKVERRYDSPTRVGQRHSMDYSLNQNVHAVPHASNQPQAYPDNLRQSSLPLSPAFFVDDDESVPIPHLPALMVPGMGSSYDSFSIQGQGQQNYMNHNGYHQQYHPRSSLLSQQQQQQQPMLGIPNQVTTMPGGKRKIHLQLWEDVSSAEEPEPSSFLSFRKKGILRRSPQQTSTISELDDANHDKNGDINGNDNNKNKWADRGTLTVSWYEGTSSLELQEHVQNTVIRKLGLKGTTTIKDFRVLDESSDFPEGVYCNCILSHWL